MSERPTPESNPPSRAEEASSLAPQRRALQRLLQRRLARGEDEAEIRRLMGAVEAAGSIGELVALAPLVNGMPPPEPDSPGHDRRIHHRVPCWLALRVLDDGSYGFHFIRDIGIGGFAAHIQTPLPLFTTLHCQVPLYHLGKVHVFTARVVWCQPDPPSLVGFEFVEIDDEAADWILSLMRAEAPGPGPG
ncbi:MAG: PilZ domain-containing protein [Armatimonadetes bacterium]|nr:PilZ domain-containing protein [Armatimonadota bacterium]